MALSRPATRRSARSDALPRVEHVSDTAAVIRAPSRARLVMAGALVAAIALGTALRMAPARQPGSAFIADAAFHDRMIRATAVSGHVPVVDSLSEAPRGRRIADWLPPGLYVLGGAFVRALAVAGVRDPLVAELWFVALAGALIALPVFAATWAVFRDPWAATIAAAIAVFLPAHLHRTWCYWLRYDALGTLLAMTHVAFALAALAPAKVRTARIHAVASGVALFAAMWVWRVALVFPILETGFVALLVVLRPPERAVREWFTAIVVTGTLAALGIEYQRQQALLAAPAWLFAIGLCLALHTPWLRRPDARLATRVLMVASVAVAAFLLGMAVGRERPYDVTMRVLRLKLGLASARGAAPDPLASLSLRVEELASLTRGEWLGPGVFSWLGAWLILAPLVMWWAAGGPSPTRLRQAPPAGLLLGVLTIALAFLTVLLVRNKVLLAPLAAMVCGGSWRALRPVAAAAPAAAPGRGARKPDARARPSRRGAWPALRVAGALAFAACVAMTLRDGVWLAVTRQSRLDPGLLAALEALHEHAPKGATVLSLWGQGYEVQRYAERATLVDGFLEGDVARQRLVETAGAFMQSSTDSLAAVCRRYGATWLLVPPSEHLYGVAVITGVPFLYKLVPPGIPLTRAEADHVIIRMMVLGESLPPFERVFERDGYRVYRLAGARAPD
jgi:hypothetical protein